MQKTTSSLSRDDGTSEAERLGRLVEVGRALNSNLDLRSIIRQILQAAIHLIPAADSGVLYIYEPEAGDLVVYDTIGLGPEMFGIVIQPGHGLVGRAYLSQTPKLYADIESVIEHISDGGAESLRRYAAANGRLGPPKSAMTAPLMYRDKAVGVLTVDNLQQSGMFHEFDLMLLDSLAQTAALAIANAKVYEAERDARSRLESLNQALHQQYGQLQRQLNARTELGELVRGDFTIQTVASRLATICDGRVWILDPFYQVLASEPRVSSRLFHEIGGQTRSRLMDELQRSMKTGTIRQTSLDGVGSVLIAPVCAGPLVDGFVLLGLSDRIPDSVDETALESASLVTALLNLRKKSESESELRSRADLLVQSLEGKSQSAASGLSGLRPPLCLVVGQVRATSGTDIYTQPDLAAFQRFQTLAQRSEPECVVAVFQERLAILLSLSDARSLSSVEASISALSERLCRAEPSWEADFAICEPVDDLAMLPSVFHEARVSIVARRQLGLTPRVALVRSLGAYRFLLRTASDKDIVEFCRQTLAPILTYEAAHGGSIVATYRAYLANDGSIKATATALGVHPHTIQYRLERLQSVTGLSLKRYEERLTLEMASRILDIASPSNRPGL